MAEIFDRINAPRFCDFDQDDHDDTVYFENNHEVSSDPLNTSDYHDQLSLASDDLENMTITNEKQFRRSMSFGDLQMITSHMHKLRNGKKYWQSDIADDLIIDTNSGKTTETQTVAFSNNHMSISKERLNQLAQPKSFKSEPSIFHNDYVPMAEAVRKFQSGTPKRFRSKPKSTNGDVSKATIPHSPKLKTTDRNRPVCVLSHEEQEQKDAEEAKKCQFKAHPLNKKIFKSPLKPNIETKKHTIPEPFKITAPPKKVAASPVKKVQEFHAKPVPKSLYDPKQPVIKPALKVPIINRHSTLTKRCSTTTGKTKDNKNETITQQQLKPTKPLPFSFEMRDKCMQSKREKLLQSVLEAEKKAREFHARPTPKSVPNCSRNISSASSSHRYVRNVSRTKSQETLTLSTTSSNSFRAKPPTVLYKKPFEPKKENRPFLEPNGFVLNTDIRGKERQNFDAYIKEKESKIAQLKEQEEIRRKLQELDETLRVRKQAEFKAQEIKKYKEVKIQPSLKITTPVSPSFSYNRHKNGSANKENISSD